MPPKKAIKKKATTAKKKPAKKPVKKPAKKPVKKDKLKKPLNPYFQFIQDERPGVKAKNPDATIGEIAKILGKLWKDLPEDKKQKYKDKAAKDLQKHITIKAKIEKERPKRKPSKYNLFMKAELAKIKKANPAIEHKKAFSQAAANWSKSKK